MSIRCSAYMAASLDGFIAKADGDIDWLHNPAYFGVPFNGLEYDDFIATVDALVMGRNSYEKVRTFGAWPYENTPVIVLTSRPLDIPPELEGKVRVENCPPGELVSVLEREGKRHLYIDGGKIIQSFIADGLINEITVTLIPILLGSGIPLFSTSGPEIPLKLISTDSSENGFVQVRYGIDRTKG